jgi:hypothetical protein
LYAADALAREQSLKSQQDLIHQGLLQQAQQGITIQAWRTLKERRDPSARVGTQAKAYVVDVTDLGGLRIALEDEPFVRVVYLDNTSLPRLGSRNPDEHLAA